MIITKISTQVKRENRVNLYIDGKYTLSLDIYQIVELGIKVGAEIDATELKELHSASVFGKVYAQVLNWILIRPRSEREVRDYLRKRELRPVYQKDRDGKVCVDGSGKPLRKPIVAVDADKLVARLCEKGYLNDERFANWWVENRFVKKGVSRRKLELDLRKKGVSNQVIQRALSESGRNELDEIEKIIARKRDKYSDEKLANYLTSQGFDYQLVQKSLRQTPDF